MISRFQSVCYADCLPFLFVEIWRNCFLNNRFRNSQLLNPIWVSLVLIKLYFDFGIVLSFRKPLPCLIICMLLVESYEILDYFISLGFLLFNCNLSAYQALFERAKKWVSEVQRMIKWRFQWELKCYRIIRTLHIELFWPQKYRMGWQNQNLQMIPAWRRVSK